MRLYLIDKKEEMEITLKEWDGSGYGPDMFQDLETNFPLDHEREEDGDRILCTSEEYEELKIWWTEEVRRWNSGEPGQNGTEYQVNENIFLFAD